MIRLSLQDGTQHHLLEVERLPARIGRSAECDVRLPGDATVSRVHAFVVSTEHGLEIQDAGSRNGTFLNGQRVEGSALLTAADRVRIGPFVLSLVGDGDDQQETVEAGGPAASRVRMETGLSAREIEVLGLVAAGCTDQQVAERLFLSVKTVHSHLDRIRDKTGCRRRPELVRFALDHGIV
ncbi:MULTISPECIES: FHA domain-containing protein [unclassified Nocardioides]|uniref:FHA domain-containing protein n=1 Tax=unclassified Nocardioides TaxID=2615069 RepID=UPI0006FCAA78|nr:MULTISPECIES: FHA domain-containing protein [unclassified Nocardioides]KQY57042.1 hypothetical protein ASD30_12325 [Nocardioides sp. Root140]KRF11682.1 hypothetical protein ASH02_16970 [Nocardioides sp. Soil796]